MPAGGWPSCSRLAIFIVALACDVAAAVTTLPHHRLDATLSRTAPHIRGTLETTFTNRGTYSLDALVLVLFANRFATPDTGVTDVNLAEDDVRRALIAPRDADRVLGPFEPAHPGTLDGGLDEVTRQDGGGRRRTVEVESSALQGRLNRRVLLLREHLTLLHAADRGRRHGKEGEGRPSLRHESPPQ